jgi:hypothetical protein
MRSSGQVLHRYLNPTHTIIYPEMRSSGQVLHRYLNPTKGPHRGYRPCSSRRIPSKRIGYPATRQMDKAGTTHVFVQFNFGDASMS